MNSKPVTLRGVGRRFRTLHVLDGLTFEISHGEFVAIVGPSGCGKTTLLNLLSGYDTPSSGSIARSGSVRMIYQQGGLLPWKTASENIMLGVPRSCGEGDRERLLSDMLGLIGLTGFGDHYPHQLSGGMRQRVELGRALIGESDMLLMDEPFSALDYLTRLRMRGELARLLRERPRTVALVTHDIEEAAQLADRVLVLSGSPARITHELRVTLPRPRDLTHPQVVGAVHSLLAELGLESDTAVPPFPIGSGTTTAGSAA